MAAPPPPSPRPSPVPASERGSRGPASVLAAAVAVDPVLHRLRQHREPWVDPGSGAYRIHTSRPCLYPACSRARLLPALRSLSSPRPPSRGPSLTRATAAAGGEQAQPLKLPPGPELGPGSGSGATVGGVRCEGTGPRCVHAVGLGGRGDERGRRGRRYGLQSSHESEVDAVV